MNLNINFSLSLPRMTKKENTKTHQKHSNLSRPNLGKFGRNELAIVGFNCSNIQQLAQAITTEIKPQFQVAYVDADHQSSKSNHSIPQFELTDKIDFYQLHWQDADFNLYKKRMQFNKMDLVLVNGNHFEAARQLVCIDVDRLPSLQKRITQFTNVSAFVLKDSSTNIPDFLKEKINNWQSIPVFLEEDTQSIIQFIQDDLMANIPTINGLILAGGKSQRMGQDKGSLNYYGKPHREYLAELIQPFCESTFISTNEKLKETNFPLLPDTFMGMGPMGAILSAFQQKPDSAWLVMACDYPLMSTTTIQQLTESRQPSKTATAFQSVENDFPEPLVTIYEPKSYPILLQFLAQGYACPRKMLINANIHLLQAKEPEVFKNVNHPEEMEAVLKQIDHTKIDHAK